MTANDTHTVGANRKVLVGQVKGLKAASQSHSVAATRTVNVGANEKISAGSETKPRNR